MSEYYKLRNLSFLLADSVLKAISYDGIVKNLYKSIKEPQNFFSKEYKIDIFEILGKAAWAIPFNFAKGLAHDYKEYAADDEFHTKDYVPYIVGFTAGFTKNIHKGLKISLIKGFKDVTYQLSSDYFPNYNTSFLIETGAGILSLSFGDISNISKITEVVTDNIIFAGYINTLHKPVSNFVKNQIKNYFNDNPELDIALFGENDIVENFN